MSHVLTNSTSMCSLREVRIDELPPEVRREAEAYRNVMVAALRQIIEANKRRGIRSKVDERDLAFFESNGLGFVGLIVLLAVGLFGGSLLTYQIRKATEPKDDPKAEEIKEIEEQRERALSLSEEQAEAKRPEYVEEGLAQGMTLDEAHAYADQKIAQDKVILAKVINDYYDAKKRELTGPSLTTKIMTGLGVLGAGLLAYKFAGKWIERKMR